MVEVVDVTECSWPRETIYLDENKGEMFKAPNVLYVA